VTDESESAGADLVDFALRYVHRGFRVLPCHPGTKAPLCEHGAKDATTDEAMIREWFQRLPHAGIGMALGGLLAVDVDVRDGKRGDETFDALVAKHGPLPNGPVQRTRSGGRHYLLRAREGASYPGTAGTDIDLKHGPHSYICVEPTPNYTWLDEEDPWRDDVTIPEAPQWLERIEAAPSPERDTSEGRTLPRHEVERIRAMLRHCGDFDNHDAWVRAGMALHHETGGSGQGFELWTTWAQQSAKFNADEQHKRWQSFARTDGQRVTLASLVFIARGNGWREEPSEQWGELSLPGAIKTPAISADLLPGIIGDMAAATARSTQTPEAASVMCALAVLAASLQRRFEVAPYGDEYRETLSLWTLVALPSGARKTAIIGALAAPLHHYEKLERDRLRAEIARTNSRRLVAKKRIEALTQQAAKAEPKEREQLRQQIEDEELAMPAELRARRLTTGDVTPERCQGLIAENGERITLLSDEPGIFQVLAGQYSGGVANIDAFLQSHSGAPFRVDRAGREAHVDRPALSFGLMIQPGILAELAGVRRFRDSGLLARFLFAIPESLVGARDVRARIGIPPAVREEWEQLLFALLPRTDPAPPGQALILDLSDDARELWLAFAEKVERNQGAGGRLEAISDWSAKLPGAAARIAALLELAHTRGEARAVGADCMRRAVRLASLLIPHAEAAFRMLGADAVEDDARALLRWIQANRLEQFKRSEAQKALEGRFRTVKRLEDAAARLAEWNALSPVRMQRNAGSRPTPLYLVNPALFDDSRYSL